MKKVIFIKSGAPYGYGYAQGEAGVVRADDFERLEKAGVVKAANGEATTTAEEREKAVDKTKIEKR